MTTRPRTYTQCWRYARTVGYRRGPRGWLRACSDLSRPATPMILTVIACASVMSSLWG